MRVLWLCNICLPAVAEEIGIPVLNKEGWLTGLADAIVKNAGETGLELGICFPVPVSGNAVSGLAAGIRFFSFHEEVLEAHGYRKKMESEFKKIVEAYEPDVIHIFGTEYPHTLAMLNCCSDKSRVLVGIQGLCFEYAKYYMADMPEKIRKKVTFRDLYKRDTLKQQQKKFIKRGEFECSALKQAVHITGRTKWDERLTGEINPGRQYHFLNETLREPFYHGIWDEKTCERYSIFVSQGNYPIKGLHYVLPVIGAMKEEYPEIHLYVAGDLITAYENLKDRIKISAYGRYLLKLIRENNIEEHVTFLGRLNAREMKNRFLTAHLYLSPSAIENSPNSLGEAMLLGVPVVSSRVGGVESMITDQEEGLLYETASKEQMEGCIRKIFTDSAAVGDMTQKARKRAEKTHHADTNYQRLLEIYGEISAQAGTGGTGSAEKTAE